MTRATKDEPSLFGAERIAETPAATPPPSKPPAPVWQSVPAGAVRGEQTITRGKDGWFYLKASGGRCFATMADAVAFVESLP